MIRVRVRGQTPDQIVRQVAQLVGKVDWPKVGNYILSRIGRLKNVSECPVVYIGSAGTRESSKNTLRGRHEEFSGRHTAMYPVWALLYFGWELEFGWKEYNNPKDAESDLKQRYAMKHVDKLPALVKR